MNARVIHLQPRTAAAPVTPHLKVHAYVSLLLEATNSLLRDGLLIVGFHADVFTVAPSLWVADCPWVRNLARVGIANYDRSGSDASGPYRVGVFERCGVTVSWIERVPS